MPRVMEAYVQTELIVARGKMQQAMILLEDGHVKAEGAERHGNMTAVPATPDYREGQGH